MEPVTPAVSERFAKYVAEKGWAYVDASGWLEINGAAEWVDIHVIEKHATIDEERFVSHELEVPEGVFDMPGRWEALVEIAEAGFKRAITEES